MLKSLSMRSFDQYQYFVQLMIQGQFLADLKQVPNYWNLRWLHLTSKLQKRSHCSQNLNVLVVPRAMD